jgi:hypothetical protein
VTGVAVTRTAGRAGASSAADVLGVGAARTGRVNGRRSGKRCFMADSIS